MCIDSHYDSFLFNCLVYRAELLVFIGLYIYSSCHSQYFNNNIISALELRIYIATFVATRHAVYVVGLIDDLENQTVCIEEV